MIKITQDIVEEIKSKLDIVDIASEWVNLKKTGSNYKGLCPFHKEKTPSFVVNPEKQIFHCFGCQVGGDVISFVEKIEGLNFVDVIHKLADYAGVKLPETTSKTDYSNIERRQELIDTNIMARDYYVSRINDKGNRCAHYALQRCLSEETIRDFCIGYAPDSWDGFATTLTSRGESLANAVSLGLIKEKNGKYYDTFRDRMMFPILNHRGEVIAFGGRILQDSVDAPKYINSRESDLYKKGEVLYGLYQTNKHIREVGYSIIVEGYMDFISLYQAGIRNVVATLGTSFTEKQVRLIKRYTNRVVLFYDSDEAGVEAAKRSLTPLLENGLRVDALFLDGVEDPDDAVKTLGREELEDRLKEAQPLMGKIIIDKFSGEHRIDELSQITAEVLSYIGKIPDGITKMFWLKELSIRSGLALKELNGLMENYLKRKNTSSNVVRNVNVGKADPLHRNTVRILFLMPELSYKVFDEEWEEFLPSDLRFFIHKIRDTFDEKGELTISDWLSVSRELGLNWIESFLSRESINRRNSVGMNLESEFRGCMVRFKMNCLEQRRLESLRRIKEGESSENTLREYKAIIEEINQLKPR